MSTTLTRAHCPKCGDNRETIFIRSDDDTDLVCRSQSCREGRPLAMLPTERAPSSRRNLEGKRR